METPNAQIIASLLSGEQPEGVDTIAYLDDMVRAFPYSHLLQMLRAKAYYDAGKDTDKKILQLAYAYAPDKVRFLRFVNGGEAGQGLAGLPQNVSRKSKQQAIIDKFLEANPRISPRREELPEPEIAQKSLADDSFLVSETLAEVLLKQGKPDSALDIYEKLCLKYPEKSSYFAKKIRDIKSASA